MKIILTITMSVVLVLSGLLAIITMTEIGLASAQMADNATMGNMTGCNMTGENMTGKVSGIEPEGESIASGLSEYEGQIKGKDD